MGNGYRNNQMRSIWHKGFLGVGLSLCLGLSLGLLSGCATLSQEECHTADWQTIGFEDGSRGYHSQRLGAHREACAEYGVAPNMQQYLAGHARGLRAYCTHGNGFALGEKGGNYNDVCPRDISGPFLAGFQQGRDLYQLNQQITAVSEEYQATLDEIDQLDQEIAQKREMVIAQSTGVVLRRELLAQIDALEEAIAARQHALADIAHRKERLERRYQQLRRSAGRY